MDEIKMADQSLGSILRLSRHQSKLTQSEAAFRAGMSPRHLSFLETGRARASRGAIDRLANVFALSIAQADQLRIAAGFAPGCVSAPGTDLTTDLFALAVDLDSAGDIGAMVRRSRTVLAALGIRQYFFGRIRRDRRGQRALRWHNPATFPAGWLEQYSARGYAATDPLLAMAECHDRSFLWTEAFVAAKLCDSARRMFEDAASAGIINGAIVPLHRVGGITDFVSFMGNFPDCNRSLVRVGLQSIGIQMLDQARLRLEDPCPDGILPNR